MLSTTPKHAEPAFELITWSTPDSPPEPVHESQVEALIHDHRAVAVGLARRFSRGPFPDADMVQVAMIGLLLAARRYDESIGPFRPYASATVSGELKKHLRSAGWSVRVSRSLQEDVLRVERAGERLVHELGRTPTADEVAVATGLSEDAVVAADRARAVRFCGEFPVVHPEDGETIDRSECLVVRDALRDLDPDDRKLLAMRFVHELTQREIAERLGISQPQVHRRIRSALSELEAVLASIGFEP